MNAIANWLIAYCLNSLWQVPLVFAAASLAAWLARPAGHLAEHRIWVGALFLESILPLCHFDLAPLWRTLWTATLSLLRGSSADGEVRVLITLTSASKANGFHLPTWLSSALLLACGVSLLYFSARFAWGIRLTHNTRRKAQPLAANSHTALNFLRLGRRMGFSAGRIASSSVANPVTIGIRHPVLLLPANFPDTVPTEDMDTVLAHELAHMLRSDFALNLVYRAVSLPIAWHPALWLTRSRIAETRELVCDTMAAETLGSRDTYARSLLRLASILVTSPAASNLHAIGIFDANIFERRVMDLTRKHSPCRRGMRLLIAAVCVALALATCASALSLRMDLTPAQTPSAQPKKIRVEESSLRIVTKVQPVYPLEAKQAGIQGSVQLNVVISKEGVPENISVQSGPADLQRSAIDAVRQWRWEPVLLNGDPVEVETTINIIYSLAK